MGPDDATELGHRVGETDADAGGHGALQCAHSLRPDDGKGRPRAGNCDDQAEVLHHCVLNYHQDDIAYYDGKFDWCMLVTR